MKEMLGNLAKGEIEFYTTVRILNVDSLINAHALTKAMQEWERIIPVIQRIRVDV
jgi:sorting nexin-4